VGVDQLNRYRFFKAEDNAEKQPEASLSFTRAGILIVVLSYENGGERYPLNGKKADFL
jgi:hypothetical protein